MSYCRWSSDDFQCDVYTYADVSGGYTTHVASNRPVIDRTTLPPLDGTTDAWLARHQVVMGLLADADRVDINGPHDGETFNDPTPADAADRLEDLRAAGYVVPEYAIADLRNEPATEGGDG